jgi:protein-tyrosine phosphatase
VQVSEHRYPEPAVTVLLVCTGNICRSALGERLGRAFLEEYLGDDAGAIRLISAGTQAVVGSGMHPDSALVLRGLGAEPGDFAAQQLDEALVRQADLTLTMTTGHRRDVLTLAPRALARTFTVREAADLLDLVDDDAELPGKDFAERARALVQAMSEARPQRKADSAADDVPDPINRPVEVHEEAGELIAAALLPVLERLASLLEPGDEATDTGGPTRAPVHAAMGPVAAPDDATSRIRPVA